MVTLKIKVTKEILLKSKDCGGAACYAVKNCAIALAIRDIFPDSETWGKSIKVFKNFEFVGQISLPMVAQDFIVVFDTSPPERRVSMGELEFEIAIPDEIIEKINIDELRPLLENHPTLELV